MSYFKYFPKSIYSTNNYKSVDVATNLVVRFSFLGEVLNTADAFYPVVIRDGERPDTIAHKYYGDAKYAWLVSAFNQYIDPLFEWPLTQEEFDAYIKREYGTVAAAKEEIKYYYKTLNKKDYIVDAAQAYDKTITAYDFENDLNEDRRNIKLIDRNLLPKVEEQLEKIFIDG